MLMRSKVILSYVIVIALITGTIGFLSIKRAQEAHLEEEKEKIDFVLEAVYTLIDLREDFIQERVQNNLNVAGRMLRELGPTRLEPDETDSIGPYTLPSLYAGNTKLSMNFNFVDQVSDLVGGQTTVFVLHNNEFVRISTNVRIETGDRAVGTAIGRDSAVYQSVINKNPYYARAWVVDQWYVTAYKPILDTQDRVIGMLFSGKPEIDDKFAKILTDARFGQKGYVYLTDSSGELIFHPTHQGENIRNYNYFNELVRKKEGTLYYTFGGKERLATFRYFEPWDWYVVSSVSIDEIKSDTQGIVNTIITIGLIMFVIVMAIFVNQKLTNIHQKNTSQENNK